jgi:hypothetical protein
MNGSAGQVGNGREPLTLARGAREKFYSGG